MPHPAELAAATKDVIDLIDSSDSDSDSDSDSEDDSYSKEKDVRDRSSSSKSSSRFNDTTRNTMKNQTAHPKHRVQKSSIHESEHRIERLGFDNEKQCDVMNNQKEEVGRMMTKKRSRGVNDNATTHNKNNNKKKPTSVAAASASCTTNRPYKQLQAGLVLEEDIFSSSLNGEACGNDHDDPVAMFVEQQQDRIRQGLQPYLYEDPDFPPVASSIQGVHEKSVLDYLLTDGSSSNNNNKSTDEFFVTTTTTAAAKMGNGTTKKKGAQNDIISYFPKCRCGRPCQLSYKRGSGKGGKGNNDASSTSSPPTNRPYFQCANPGRKCQWFSWAFMAELTPFYRFGTHNNHQLLVVAPEPSPPMAASYHPTESSSSTLSSFSAQDLVQGKVGDCWFLSALAVVAERPDLIQRLFQREGRLYGTNHSNDARSIGEVISNDWHDDDRLGIVRVNLFVDGWWTKIVMDNFLPCFVGQVHPREEDELKRALQESLKDHTLNDRSNSTKNKESDIEVTKTIRNPYAKQAGATTTSNNPLAAMSGRRLIDNNGLDASSISQAAVDPFSMSNINVKSMKAVCDFLDTDRRRRFGITNTTDSAAKYDGCVLDRPAESQDLSYSKGRGNQLWVPFIEKAYCKVYGSYKAISGGHIAEAFLDLTGAPTLQIQWHQNNSHLNSCIMEPKPLWSKLLQWRSQRLPMGCGTDNSAGGIIGMHAYSILDVREIHNVGVEFFQDHLLRGTLGNVSGFTEYDGIVRLLRIRNPHGKGEWKGDFSDKSDAWQRLLAASGVSLPRTNADDGTFWIGYDDFLMGFANIDVVLAFEGNHAKSFASNFPEKTSNHRCTRAFEVSLLDPQPGIETKDQVEVYIMAIQKSRRGAARGRSDRKKSYKVSDLGVIVGECPLMVDDGERDEDEQMSYVHGQMFGFRRDGHYRLLLDRRRCRRMVVMPVSFGHPAATDKELSYVVRFNSDAPLMIRELPKVPRMDYMLREFLFGPKSLTHFAETRQGQQKVLYQKPGFCVVQTNCLGNHGGTVFVYFCMNDSAAGGCHIIEPISLVVTATCRGMSCRIDGKLLEHETVAKGKKFEAAWRRYTSDFVHLTRSQLLMVLYQSGQDTEMGTITCHETHRLGNDSASTQTGNRSSKSKMMTTTLDLFWQSSDPTQPSSGHSDPEYVSDGIFHPVPMDAQMFRSCGKSEVLIDAGNGPAGAYTGGDAGGYEGSDSELLRVLDLSRQEIDLEEAILASLDAARNSNGDNAVGDGWEAKSGTNSFSATSHAETDDAELQEALKKSLLDSSTFKGNVEDIVVLDDDDDDDNGDTKQALHQRVGCDASTPSQSVTSKKGIPSSSSGKEILDLTSDNEEEKNGLYDETEAIDEGNATPVDRESKRRQMAEAAMKRIEKMKSEANVKCG